MITKEEKQSKIITSVVGLISLAAGGVCIAFGVVFQNKRKDPNVPDKERSGFFFQIPTETSPVFNPVCLGWGHYMQQEQYCFY